MRKQQKTSNSILQLTLAFVVTVFFWDTALGLSDKRLCADENCKTIISTGKGLINYPAGEEGMVSFKVNSNIRIKSKSAGSDPSLWGIDVNGREGFAPKRLIREEKIFVSEKDLKYLVDIVKPGEKMSEPSPVPVLNASDILIETTTSQPLEITNKDEAIIKSSGEIMNHERPQTATVVQHESIEIEGTKQSKPSSMLGIEYEDDDGDGGIGDYDEEDGEEEEDEKNQSNAVDSTPEKEPAMKTTTLSPSTKYNDTNLLDPLNNKEETIGEVTPTENPQEQAFNENVEATATTSSTDSSPEQTGNENVDATASISSTVNSEEDKGIVNNLKDISPIISVKNDIADAEVPNIQSKITETSKGVQNLGDLYPVPTINKLTETTKNLETGEISEEHVEYRTKTGGVMETTSENTNIAHESHPIIRNETEELKLNEKIFFNDTHNEALLTATSEDNVGENHISAEFSTEFPPTTNSVNTTLNPEEFRSDTALDKESSNKLNESQDNNLPLDTNAPFVDDSVQISSNLYSPPERVTSKTENSTESVTTPQIMDPDSQFKKEIPVETQDKHLESLASENLALGGQRTTVAQNQSPQLDQIYENTNDYNIESHYNPYDYDESSNTPLPPQYDNKKGHNELPQVADIPHYNNYGHQTTEDGPIDSELEVTTANPAHVGTSEGSYSNQLLYAQSSVDTVQSLETSPDAYKQEEGPNSLHSLTQSDSVVESDKKENRGLFATIMDTVNNMLPNSKKPKHAGYDMEDRHNELDRILYSNMEATQDNKLFCEKLDPDNCPHPSKSTPHFSGKCDCSLKTLITTEFTFETLLQALASKILEISDLIAFLAIVASTSLFFIFGYYCFCNSSSEGALLSKLNQLESSLLASHKENAILKHNLMTTRQHLASIEDNSFGSNDMVVSLKKELEDELLEKAKLQEQIVTLQKELENAADAGIELNKIVSELLSSQTGDESIISSVEELQKQLNEQQNTILEINASLAEKSRENSELQLMIAEQNARYETQISDLQQDNDELEADKGNLQSRLEEIRTDYDKDIMSALESKNFEIKRLQNEIVELSDKVEAGHTKWQTSMAKVEALEECLKNVKRDPNVNITHVIDVANIRAELLDSQKKYNGLKERWELELDARKLAENQLQSATEEVEKIKQDFNQTEKDKLEAQTRLEVLSNYFKEKENQLQKELSLKEAMWLKQQGETTTTVDRLTTMQEEIQSLKSQNDALRAEIEAQVAAHKAQTGTLENRAHETWLAARQSDRRYDEARAEATALRRKLTVLAGGSINEVNKPTAGTSGLGDDLANAPSPIHMESPGSPMLGRMPPPPFLPPFMGPPPPFMGMPPPPPFVPPGEMRPAPLGRIMSPPPPQRSGHIDYEDYLDYEGNSSWHRHHTYSPPPRTYRSLSPTDSRYNYGTGRDLISTYDTETDFSPPPSPRDSRRHGGGGGYGSDKDSKSRHPYNNSKKSSSGNKAPISSGSDKSYNSSSKKGNRSKSGGGAGSKFVV